MGVSKHLVAGAILAVGVLAPATSGATESNYSVSGLIVEVDRAPSSDTIWTIKHGMQWRDDYQGWDQVNYRVVQQDPDSGRTVHELPISRQSAISDLTVLADDDVWVASDRKLFHWNGDTWTLEYTSPPETGVSVFANASDNVWRSVIFPAYGAPSYDIARWDGETWSSVPAPNNDGEHWVYGLVPLGPDDVWAFGDFEDSANNYDTTGLVWHWNGATWTEQPAVGGDFALYQGSASADGSKIWAIGDVVGPTSECDGVAPCRLGSATARLTDGELEPIQLPGDGAEIELTQPSIDSTAGGDAWVVGSRKGYAYLPLLARTLNGAWQSVDAPTQLCGDGRRLRLIDVDAETNADVYVVGSCVQRAGNYVKKDDDYHTLVAHFDGEGWMRV